MTASVQDAEHVGDSATERSDATAETLLPQADALQDDIERLAYSYWVEGGCQEGTAEEDWYRAERAIRNGEKTVALSVGA